MRKMIVGAGVGLAALGGYMTLVQTVQAEGANLFPYDVPEIVEAGQAIYTAQCASCHGANLEGQPDWQVRMENGRLPAPPHDITGHTWHHPEQQLFLLTKYGVAALVGNGYESDMPAFEGILSDEEILAVLAYIKSTWPEGVIARHNAMNAAVAGQ